MANKPGPKPKVGPPVAPVDLLTDEAVEKMVGFVRMGVPLPHAAGSAGLEGAVLKSVLDQGARLNRRQQAAIANGEPVPEGTSHERRCESIFVAVLRARADARVRLLLQIQRAAAGGSVKRRTTMADGRVIEELAPPDHRAAAWVLERIDRENFGGGNALDSEDPNAERARLDDYVQEIIGTHNPDQIPAEKRRRISKILQEPLELESGPVELPEDDLE